MAENITIYDIAKEANVSPATVSRVLTGSANVSKAKKAAIMELINKYNFHPNALARGLIYKASKSIGFILPDITNPFFAATFLEAEKHALALGYTMVLCNSMNDNSLNQTDLESLYLKMLQEKQVDGIIIMGGRVNEKAPTEEQIHELQEIAKDKPVVFINGIMRGVDSHNVTADEKTGVLKLVEYLAGLGHRDIGFIGGRKGITSTDVKLSAFEKTLEHFGLAYHPEWVVPSSFAIEDGYASMNTLLGQKKRPTAVMAVNDFTAIGAINAAKDHGLNVPDDISVTGFDGTYLADICRPRITTVSQNYSELGHQAVEAVIQLTLGKKFKKNTLIKTHLLIKDSCNVLK